MLTTLRKNKLRLYLVATLVLAFIVMQFIHLAVENFQHSNPPVTYTVQWDSEQTENLVRTACFDCHSNETVWPWYSNIAPMRWLVVRDVNEGREELNYSTGRRLELDEMIETIREGEMPPAIYLPLHPEARLSDAEKAQLIAGLQATFAGGDGNDGEKDDD